MKVQLSISPKFAKAAASVLGLVMLGLALLSIASEFLSSYLLPGPSSQADEGNGGIQLFELDSEGGIATWYSSSMLLVCAGFLAIIAIANRRSIYKIQWAALSFIFLYLSADEAASIHEKASFVTDKLIPVSGFADYSWVILYAPLVLIFVLAYLKFVRDLPVETKRLFIVAGFLYVVGALGMEAVGGVYAILYGSSNIGYSLLIHLEEVLEMSGIVVFFYALLVHMGFHTRELRIGSEGRRL